MPRHLRSVVLVGRPNVGKSTLFNRLTGSRRAIVTSVAGTTRDVITHPVDWENTRFELVDTGGMFGASEDPLHRLVLARGQQALAGADLVVLVVDGREGLVAGDEEIARAVRAAGAPPTIVAVNKIDDRRARTGSGEFHALGFDDVFEISAEHGDGVGELLDGIVSRLRGTPASTERRRQRAAGDDANGSEASGETAESGEVAVAIVGRPNAGKSSLVNRLLREERMLVSELPGTTRDAVDSVLTWHRRRFRIVDTAGIRRPGRVARSGHIEMVSVLLARRAVKAADIVVLVIDATVGATDQDAAIAGEADRAGRGIIVAVNKWDLVKEAGNVDRAAAFDERLRRQLKFLDYAPVLHLSALTGERTSRLLETIDQVAVSRRKRVATRELNKLVESVTAAHPPASPGRKRVRILYAAQTGVAPPAFVFFTNVATTFHFSYERFLINKLRDAYGFVGSPIRLHVRRKEGSRGSS
jgi:GTP-binding protein